MLLIGSSLGWLLAVLLGWLVVEHRRRLELTARAEHELRGPLGAIALGVDALGRESADSDRLETLRTQLSRARLGLDDLAAARSGARASGTPGVVALEGLVRSAALAWDGPARGRGGGVSLDWRAGPAAVRADPRRIGQALGNVLDNAVRHGGGCVEVRALAAGETGDAVRLEVLDAGAGFAAGTEPDRAAGHGRGLAIAREAAREAGGRLLVASSSRGSTVALELPLDPEGSLVASRKPHGATPS